MRSATAPTASAPGPAPAGRGPAAHAGRRGAGATTAMLTRLRAPGCARPVVDTGLAGGLRAWLEDAAAPYAHGARHPDPLLVTPAAVARADGQGDGLAARRVDGAGEAPAPRDTASRDAIARALFLLVVSGGEVRHPLDDALAVLAADEQDTAVTGPLRHARPSRRAALRREAALLAGAITEQWRPPPPAWLPRIGERLRVPLAGGAVLLAVTADLTLGGPARGTASVCMVEVRAAPPGPGDDRSRRFLALAETLRSGAPPLRVATYHPSTGDLCCDEVSDELLALAVGDVAGTLSKLAVGAPEGPAARGWTR